MAGSLAREFERYVRGEIREEIIDRLERLDDFRLLPGSEFDAFGASRETLREILPAVAFFYKFYFRTEVHGIENVTGLKRGLVIPNHMVQTPVDGINLAFALFYEPEKPRLVRALGHTVLAKNPYISTFVSRSGQVIGTPENADRLFSDDNLVLIFPEGTSAIRPYSRRYRLADFNLGFMEYAVEYGCPVVPTAVIGSEESTLVLAEIKEFKGLFNIPRFAITPTFPLFGALGFLPYPAKFRLYFGEPMDFSMHRDKLRNPAAIRGLVELVRQRVQSMLDKELASLPRFSFF